MPLTMRPIPHALNLGAPELYGQGPDGQGAQGTQVLEDVNMASMVGTLAQLGALATYAQDLFDGLFQTADSLANQVSSTSARCSRLLQALPDVERQTAEAIGSGTGIDQNTAVEAIKAERQQANQAENEAAGKVFLPEAMPRWLVERYHSSEVSRVPDLHLIDAVISSEEKQLLKKDGLDSCALRYSNPQFFYQEWYRLELERQEKSVREKKQKKEERKKRKAAARASATRAGGDEDEDSTRVPRPARKSISDWRGKFGIGSGGGGPLRSSTGRSSAGDVSSLVGNEKVVVQKREAYGEKFYRQEEEYADTGYQISVDSGVTAANPSGMQQLGALTAEDFSRKLGSITEDSRRLFQPQSARASQASAMPPRLASSLSPRPQQRPPPPQAAAAQPGPSVAPPPPPPLPSSARPSAVSPAPSTMQGGFSALPAPPVGSYDLNPPGTTSGAPPLPPPPPSSRPPPPRAAMPLPPTPHSGQHIRRPSFQEPVGTFSNEPVAVAEAPAHPSYEMWVDQPPPPQASEQFEYNAPPVGPPAPPPPPELYPTSEWSSQQPAPTPMPPSRPPVPPPLPPVAEFPQPGQPPLPPPLPPALGPGGHPPAPPPLPPALGGPGTGGAPSTRNALLASITDGKKLKQVEGPSPDASKGGGGGGNELLDAIRSGSQLKKVEQPEAPAIETSNPLFGGNPGINEILARRKYLEAESEDSDSDEDSDWDED